MGEGRNRRTGERAKSTDDGNQTTEYRRRTTAKKKESVRRGIGERGKVRSTDDGRQRKERIGYKGNRRMGERAESGTEPFMHLKGKKSRRQDGG